MEKDFYLIEGYHCTMGKMIKDLQNVAKNIGEDAPCFYTITTFQDTIRWGENIILSQEIANEIVENLWFYNQVQVKIREIIEHELDIQLKKRNLTLEDFTIK